MARQPSVFTIADLRGGINNSDSPTEIADNQVVDARNVDFRAGMLGSKRRGTAGLDKTGSVFNSPVVALFRHTPTNVLSNDELWAIDENGNIDRRVGGTWAGSVARSNDHVTVSSRNYDANAISLHGKLFIAAKGEQDRLLVWDGSVLRWAGIQQPPDPTVANSAAGGSYSGTRYFRIRYTAQSSSGATLRRSEPTNSVSLVPSGTNSGAVITKPAGTEASTSVYCEGQTHWEVEASIDNVLFYRIATVVVGTATYTDTTSLVTGYAATGALSENIGEYVPPTSARHVTVDEDRVVLAGSNFTPGNDATVWWTPVAADDGVGNDERVPITTENFISFDGLDGGGVAALVSGVAGNVYVFKGSRIYKMVRTGIAESAYSPVAESFSRGSTSRGACVGTDQAGLTCAYFLDPSVGLCRIGRNGIEDLGRAIRNTWLGRNPNPAISSRIVYYPALEQVWFTLPINSPDVIQASDQVEVHTSNDDQIVTSQTVPGLLIEHEVRHSGLMFHDGLLGKALTLGLQYRDTGLAPVIGTNLLSMAGGGTTYVHQGDIGTTDSDGDYRAYVRTKPYMIGNLWSKFGLMAAALIAQAAAGTTLLVRMIRNFGVEQRDVTADLSPSGSETSVVKPIDNASMSELNTVQIEYGDSAAGTQVWSLDRLVLRVRAEEDAA